VDRSRLDRSRPHRSTSVPLGLTVGAPVGAGIGGRGADGGTTGRPPAVVLPGRLLDEMIRDGDSGTAGGAVGADAVPSRGGRGPGATPAGRVSAVTGAAGDVSAATDGAAPGASGSRAGAVGTAAPGCDGTAGAATASALGTTAAATWPVGAGVETAASPGASTAGATVAAPAAADSSGTPDFAGAFFVTFAGSSGWTSRISPSRSAFLRTRSACAPSIPDEWLFTPMPSDRLRSSASLLVSPSSFASS
jgi:hypothetical protein